MFKVYDLLNAYLNKIAFVNECATEFEENKGSFVQYNSSRKCLAEE